MLRATFGADDPAINHWCGTRISEGIDTYEALLAADTRSVGSSFGNTPTIADTYLIPQIKSARRFKVDLGRWPRMMAVDVHRGALEAFRQAAPMA